MNPSCSRCNRVVYPTEIMNCLDKHWHKKCFTCEVCNMTLNMKNYKGYDKKPYCNAHYPKGSYTCVTDTPENIRLKEQTKMQSNVLYREDFEKNKGKGFHAVAETPEMQRLKKTQAILSNVKYHEEYERTKRGATQPAPFQPPAAESAPSGGVKYHDDYDRMKRGGGVATQPNPSPAAYQPPAAVSAPASSGGRYRAIYDYSAADDDEVSFMDGDVIVDVQHIDEGWMHGRVERTGQLGMLPANYVEAI
ncbi:LIM and SH3 domain protein 1-like [Synchiropus picturatus]